MNNAVASTLWPVNTIFELLTVKEMDCLKATAIAVLLFCLLDHSEAGMFLNFGFILLSLY